MGLQRIGPLRCEGMAHRRPLGMANPGMNVIDPFSHHLDRNQIGRHQSFGDATPMAQVCREPQPRMTLEPDRYLPGIEQTAAAVGLHHHRTGLSLGVIKNRLQKSMLLGLRPTVAARDQIDLEWVHSPGTIQSPRKLIKVLLGAMREIGCVPTPGGDFQDQRAPTGHEQVPHLIRRQRFHAGMVDVAFQAIESLALSTIQGGFQRIIPAPE